jgi:transcriptional regulator with XRE-family HTH domain
MNDFEDFLKQVGVRVRKLRTDLGLTIEAVSHRVDMHPSFWSQVERGVKLPSLKSIHKMAIGLHCSPSVLLAVEDADPGPVIGRELATLIEERPRKNLTRLLSVMREVLGYWEA